MRLLPRVALAVALLVVGAPARGDEFARPSYNQVQQDASNLPQQRVINFTGGGVTCTNNAGSKRTDCTIASGLSSVFADAPLGGNGSSGSHLTCALCVTTTGAQALSNKSIDGASGNTFANIPESAVTSLTTDLAGKVPTSRTVSTSGLLGGGGALSGNLTLTCATCVANTRTLTAGTGLTGGGDLSADRSFAVAYGATAGTAAQGNDSRLPPTPSSGTSQLYDTGTTYAEFTCNSANYVVHGTAGGGSPPSCGPVANADLSNPSATVSTTSPLGGGGTLTLGASLTLTCSTCVTTSRTISAGTGLTGGGDLSANRTLTLADTAVTPATYGDGSHVGTFTVDQQGRITAASSTAIALAESAITGLTSDLSGKVPTTRNITAGTGLSGGGDLSADRTLSLPSVGPGAGTIGGSPNFVQSITLDAQGRVTAAVSAGTSVFGGAFYGDGSDGVCTFDGTATPACATKDSSTHYTQTRDCFCTTSTVSNNVTVFEAGYRHFGSTSITVNSSCAITDDGNAGATSTAGAGLFGGTLGNGSGTLSQAGTNGATAGGSASNAGGTSNNFNGGAGGNGGASTGGGSGGTGGTITGPNTATTQTVHDCLAAYHGLSWIGSSSTWVPIHGGAGGAGGGSSAAGSIGGGGGSGGGFVWVATPTLTINGVITAAGGAGANASGTGNGGGGGGGGGGVAAYFYHTISGSFTPGSAGVNATTSPGGAFGALAGSGHNGVAGSSGIYVPCAN
jgi:trimeric autotransporter adhesin